MMAWCLTSVIPANPEVEIRRLQFEFSSGRKFMRSSHQPIKPWHMVYSCHPVTGSINKRIKTHDNINARPCSKDN
jgi:hypothetical protein